MEASEKPITLTDLDRPLIRRIAELSAHNSVVLGLRLTCRFVASALPDYTTVRLHEPVPEWAFAEHFSTPEAVRSMSLRRRRKLICVTAATGSVVNTLLLVSAAVAAARGARKDRNPALVEWVSSRARR